MRRHKRRKDYKEIDSEFRNYEYRGNAIDGGPADAGGYRLKSERGPYDAGFLAAKKPPSSFSSRTGIF